MRTCRRLTSLGPRSNSKHKGLWFPGLRGGGIREGGGGGGQKKKKKKMASLFLGGLDFFFFFFVFFGLAPCPTPSFYYHNHLFAALFISKPLGIREGGGGKAKKKKKKNWHPFF